MKIAYLVHSERDYDEIIETLNQLVKQNDHAFVMINDNDLRDKVAFVFADHPRVHISHTQEFAQEGDLSLARGTIIQMKEALEFDQFDYFINLTDGMIPLKSRHEIVSFLEKNPGKDYYYVASKETPELRKKAERYYMFTNLLAFPSSRFIRGLTRGNAALFSKLGLKRKLDEHYQIGSPWFMLSAKTAQILTKHFEYVSNTFKMSWYPEEMYIPMMMDKFVYTDHTDDHINADYRLVGPNGTWQASSGAKPITEELLRQHPEALFGGQITAQDNLDLYQDYFDIYNSSLQEKEEETEKEFVDPEQILHALQKSKEKFQKEER